MRSEGRFIFSVAHGLYWKISAPFQSELILTTSGKVITWDANSSNQKFKTQDFPDYFGIAEVLISIFAGELETLQKHFDIYFEGNLDDWSIGLKPLNSEIHRIIQQIVLKGSKNIETVKIRESSSDTTILNFIKIVLEPQSLSPEEQGYFER